MKTALSKLSEHYIKGDPNRQELLEKALTWIADIQNTTINDYMAQHKSDDDADELWQYWQEIINWVRMTFPQYYKEMEGLDWGELYNKYHSNNYNSLLKSQTLKIYHFDHQPILQQELNDPNSAKLVFESES